MMEFSNALREGGPWAWSPDGTFLAACDSSRLVVRDTKTLMVVTVFSNLDVCNVVEWSRDGRYILCAMYKRGIVQVTFLVPGGMG
jgi:WD40 repeat protein